MKAQTLTFDPKLGPAIPMPNWFKVVHQDNDSVTIEGDLPDEPNAYQRSRRVQIVFKFDGKGDFKRLCLRRIKGESKRYNSTDWHPYSQGGQVLTHRMMSNLATAKTGNWW